MADCLDSNSAQLHRSEDIGEMKCENIQFFAVMNMHWRTVVSLRWSRREAALPSSELLRDCSDHVRKRLVLSLAARAVKQVTD